MNAPASFKNAKPLTAPRFNTIEECRDMARGRGKSYGAFGCYDDEQLAVALFAITGERVTKVGL
ncbi:MAG TPA: hypothetical protein VF637_12845 [Sphingomicrobium sp.]|jgi:hypothetical protein